MTLRNEKNTIDTSFVVRPYDEISKRPAYSSSHRWPAIRPRERIVPKQLIAVSVSDCRVDIVIVEHVVVHAPIFVSNVIRTAIPQDSLSSRTIHSAVALQQNTAATACATRTGLINKPARTRRAPTHHNLILCACRWSRGVITTADTLAPEQIVVARLVDHEASLSCMTPGARVGDLIRGSRALLREIR